MIRAHLPTPDAAALSAFLTTHTRAQETLIQIAGLAEITYHGRAASTAEVGAYLVMIKRDGSLQVHAPTGIKPMNWQPRTDELSARVERGYCVLHASRRSPQELVRVTFLEPHLALALELRAEAAFSLSGSEKQMQDALARHPELIEPGLTVLNRELLTDSGGIDLYARDAQGRFVVVELKRGRATQDAVSQLARYVATVQRSGVGAVRGVLAAPSITAPALNELRARGLEFREIGAWPDAPAPAVLPSLFD
ncbi:nuclease [Deinococcus radiopugnans]|uniref:Endonuclease NucS n=1 Tax=Deinococcus radiopugnans TaxID=57497 RepID=A0A0A7KGB2_9DEIO|nr:endonuclease NucS [Deinococcus radiopugnans]AIZ45186.1 nuclease [Deinococcus radiopugnans]